MQPGTVVKPKDLEAMKLGGNGPPKYGILIPNRIFVSGLSADTTEQDLFRAFNFGKIKSARIIFDRSGVSKGYGFVTFETEQDAQIALSVGKSITIKDRELSIAPAIKKSYMVKETTSGHFTPNAAAVSANNAGQLVYAGQYQLDFNAATQAMYQQAAMNQHNVAQMGAQNHQGLVQGGGIPMFYPQNIPYQQQQQQQQQQPLYYMPMDLPVYWPPQN